jgi:mRNA interferase RelE/StbE
VTYEVVWSERALEQAADLLADDLEGLAQLPDAVELLADDPRPEGTAE